MTRILILLFLSFCIGCLTMPRKKTTHLLNQDEPFQKCDLLQIINENHVLVKVRNKFYVSQLAGLSIRNDQADQSWTKDNLRKLKILYLADMIQWRGSRDNLYLLDVSPSHDLSKILLVTKNLNGYTNLTRITISKGGAIFDEEYKGPYWQNMKNANETSKRIFNGIYGEYDEKFLRSITPEGFDLNDFRIEPPDIIGEWLPSPEQREIINNSSE